MVDRENLHEVMRIAGREWDRANSCSDPMKPQFYKGEPGGWFDNEEEVYYWLKEITFDDKEMQFKINEYLDTHQIIY